MRDHEYESAVESGSLPVKRAHALDKRDRLVREFILQLKLGGVEAAPFGDKFGVRIEDYFKQPLEDMERRGFLRMNEAGVELTRRGLLQVDRLLPHFYDPRYSGARYT